MSLLDLVAGRPQPMMHHFMYAPRWKGIVVVVRCAVGVSVRVVMRAVPSGR